MFNRDHIVFGAQETADHFGGLQTLLNVKVRAGLVEHVDIGVLNGSDTYDEALKLTA